jgi:meiotic recombination protein REC8
VLRSDQLLLEDDPAFLPDILFAPLDDDFDLLNMKTGVVTDTQLTSASSLQSASSPFDRQHALNLGVLILPTSDTGEIGGFLGPSEGSVRGPRLSSQLGRDEDTALEFDGFDFDEDGNVYELQSGTRVSQDDRRIILPSETAASARVQQEHAAGRLAGVSAGVSAISCTHARDKAD